MVNWLVAALFALVLAASAAGGCSSRDVGILSLGDGLLSHYPLNANATDAGPLQRHGVVYGASGTADRFNRANGAMAFDGFDDRIVVDQEHYAADDHLSVSLWVNTNDFAGTNYFVAGSDFSLFSSGGEVGMEIAAPAANNARGPVVAGGWNHFVGTYDGTTIRAYINGQLVDARHHPGDILDRNRLLTLGSSGRDYWKGLLDEVRIFNRVLALTEVRRLFEE